MKVSPPESEGGPLSIVTMHGLGIEGEGSNLTSSDELVDYLEGYMNKIVNVISAIPNEEPKARKESDGVLDSDGTAFLRPSLLYSPSKSLAGASSRVQVRIGRNLGASSDQIW